MLIKVKDIIPDSNQPRKTFKQETIQELRDSFQGLGMIEPLTVRPYQDKYMIIIGERRYRAAQLDGLEAVECIVQDDIDDKKAREMQFAENLEHEDVPPLELGRAFLEHRAKYKMTLRELSNIVGLDSTSISRYEALCCTGQQTQEYVELGKLDYKSAVEIGTIKDEKRQKEFATLAVDEDLPRSTIEQLKPMVEEQVYRPVGNIYQDYLDRKQFRQETLPPKIEYPKEIELPARLIELKLSLEHLTIMLRHIDEDILGILTEEQKASLLSTCQDCASELQKVINQLGGYYLIEEE